MSEAYSVYLGPYRTCENRSGPRRPPYLTFTNASDARSVVARVRTAASSRKSLQTVSRSSGVTRALLSGRSFRRH